ncbi:MAG TPA: hypothetical protein VJT67_11490 [Longimicrobiaceae bacterium]|nr:hypothetical protein [Longimicrobiaceae bacterium]
MFGSDLLEVVIGIVFVYILVSIICSAVRESVEAWLKTRSAYLEHGIRELLHDTDGTALASSLYRHPLIYSLYMTDYDPKPRPEGWLRRLRWLLKKGQGLPSYIPSKNFAVALMDLAARGPATDAFSSSAGSTQISPDSIRRGVANLGSPGVQRALLTALDTAEGDLKKVQKNLENWYDSGMDRVSGWYKRSTQWIVFWIGLLVAIVFNVDTVAIADYLYKHDAERQVLVARAEAAAQDSAFIRAATRAPGDSTPPDTIGFNRAKAALDSLPLPIGWQHLKWSPKFVGWPLPHPLVFAKNVWLYVLVPLLGWAVTGLAATFGAPFWFDVLNKVMVIRSTVKPREKSPEEGSEDRQKKDDGTEVQVDVTGAATDRALVGSPPGSPPGDALPEADPGDVEADVDACDVELEDETPDDALPMATGGVA